VKGIDVLPDDVLLEVFDFYINTKPPYVKEEVEAWRSLVHVSRRWRTLVFQSPRRLNLRLVCTPKSPAKDRLDVWPALPLIVEKHRGPSSGTDNIIAALGQGTRVCTVYMHLEGWEVKEVLAPMQASFPELTDLGLLTYDKTTAVIPDSFLGGSAPRLETFFLMGIPFPGLSNLLLSASHLVDLRLYDINESWCISPEAMITSLSVLSSLRVLYVIFQPSKSRPDWECPSLPPTKRSILPVLIHFVFNGVAEFLEHFATFIGAPQVSYLDIAFFNNQIDFDCPRLAQFIDSAPKLSACDEAYVNFIDNTVSVNLRYRTSVHYGCNDFQLKISCTEPGRQLSSIQRVCKSHLHPLSTIEDLHISYGYSRRYWNDPVFENTLWLQLFLPFTGVKKLHVSDGFGPGIAAALKELVGERTTEVLPGLRYMSVWIPSPLGRFRENIAQFLTARRLSGRPVTTSVTNRPFDDWRWYEGEEEEKSTSSCMHSNSASIGREANMVVCT
jgi:hypothetical protein